MIKLYYLDRSPFSWKVRIVLAEKNVPYDATVPEKKNEDPAFARLNPFLLTPVLQLEDGKTLIGNRVCIGAVSDVAEAKSEDFAARAVVES